MQSPTYNPSTEAINADGKPDYEGQIVKFTSPFGAILFDVAERNKYGTLVWSALPVDHPLYNS